MIAPPGFFPTTAKLSPGSQFSPDPIEAFNSPPPPFRCASPLRPSSLDGHSSRRPLSLRHLVFLPPPPTERRGSHFPLFPHEAEHGKPGAPVSFQSQFFSDSRRCSSPVALFPPHQALFFFLAPISSSFRRSQSFVIMVRPWTLWGRRSSPPATSGA